MEASVEKRRDDDLVDIDILLFSLMLDFEEREGEGNDDASDK
jgi:hypothetical protein